MFRDIGSQLAEKISPSNKDFREFLTPNEVDSMINELNASKALGPHGIPISLLKLAKPVIASELSEIYNFSFTSGIFPEELKSPEQSSEFIFTEDKISLKYIVGHRQI